MEKIWKNIGKEVWPYVKTSKNLAVVVAVVGTGETFLKLFNEHFLYNNESEWPSREFIIAKVDEIEEKSKRECILISKVES